MPGEPHAPPGTLGCGGTRDRDLSPPGGQSRDSHFLAAAPQIGRPAAPQPCSPRDPPCAEPCVRLRLPRTLRGREAAVLLELSSARQPGGSDP